MASKRAAAMAHEAADANQAAFNLKMEGYLLAILEKLEIDPNQKSEKAGQDPGPAELAEVTETPQAEEGDSDPSDIDPPEDVDPDEDEKEGKGLGW